MKKSIALALTDKVPVLIGLVYVSLWVKTLLFNNDGTVKRIATRVVV